MGQRPRPLGHVREQPAAELRTGAFASSLLDSVAQVVKFIGAKQELIAEYSHEAVLAVVVFSLLLPKTQMHQGSGHEPVPGDEVGGPDEAEPVPALFVAVTVNV